MDKRVTAMYNPDPQRYPTLTEHGARMLNDLLEHPHAPIYRNQSGNRLSAEDITRVKAFETEVMSKQVGWPPSGQPVWLDDFINQCREEVPYYRTHTSRTAMFHQLPTIDRSDLSRDIAQFFPDTIPIDGLINFRTSGTTGHPLLIASHPVVAAGYLAFHKKALKRFGIDLRHGRGQVGVVLVGFQRRCFTYVSVTPTMDESGLAKINLHPDDWRDPDDRGRYLDALRPEIYTGDPISFAELAELPLNTRPRALLSTSMTMLPALRRRLEEHFACPVLDLYSLNEAGPIACYDPTAEGHVLLQHRLYLEILDPQGNALPPGQRGEITLTGGFNFCLPLLRYRTGDYASLAFHGHEPVLKNLEGRPPVRFRTRSGEWLNNIEITHELKDLPISQFTLHQRRDGTLQLGLAGTRTRAAEICEKITRLFGIRQRIDVDLISAHQDKVIQYSSAIEGSEGE